MRLILWIGVVLFGCSMFCFGRASAMPTWDGSCAFIGLLTLALSVIPAIIGIEADIREMDNRSI